jgi:hypothetical protein
MSGGFQTHLFTYRHDGAEWVLPIHAIDADDARARIGKLAYATYDGVAVARITTTLGPLGRMSTWARSMVAMMLPRFGPRA